MLAVLIIFLCSCVGLICSVLFFPQLKIGKLKLSTYWIVCLTGALLTFVFNGISLERAFNGLTAQTEVNPVKILVLFFSMTLLSVYLDQIGFFYYLANRAVKKAKHSQTALFFILYAVVSVLTVFTSNDIVVLTFTPFICYFCKHAKINPTPYLVAEFSASNTWSMLLIIGNPTNVYIASFWEIGFTDYVKVMALPTLFAGSVQMLVMYLLFKKKLAAPLSAEVHPVHIVDKVGTVAGLTALGGCLVMLIVSSYINIPMWIICFAFALALIVFCLIYYSLIKREGSPLFKSLKRLPYQLIPFVLSMFVMVLALEEKGASKILGEFLGRVNPVLSFGLASFLACNLMNNIPMSVLFSSLPAYCGNNLTIGAVYATIIGSNVGAFLTPVGALAGIMFTELVAEQKVEFGFKTFIKYGAAISLPTLVFALLGLIAVL